MLFPATSYCPCPKSISMKSSFLVIVIGLYLYFPQAANCQCSNSGVKNGTSFTNDNSVGSIAFTSPSNAGLHDGNLADASATALIFAANTQYLKSTGFGFTIPGSTSICGIVVEVEKSATGINILANVKDNSIRLVKAGSPTGSDYAKLTKWTSTQTYYTYGGATDLWGTTWSKNEINAPNFGVAFSAEINGLISLFPSALIDNIRMTVYFNIVLPLSITYFMVETGEDHNAGIEWTYEGDENNGQVNIQRKSGDKDWLTIKKYKPGETGKEQLIKYIDRDCRDEQAYYRIELISAEGSTTYSKIVAVRWVPGKCFIYPNPSTNEIFINHPEYSPLVSCTGIDGRKWKLPVLLKGTEKTQLNIRHLPRGTYILTMDGMRGIFIKK
jgi:hypothetical protein